MLPRGAFSDLHASKFVCGRGPLGELTALPSSPDPLAGFGEGNRELRMEWTRDGKRMEGDGKGKGVAEWKLGKGCIIGFRGIDQGWKMASKKT